MTTQETFYGVEADYTEETGDLVRCDTQVFPQSYWDGLQWARNEQTKAARCRNFHKVADVPAIFYMKYLKEGFDISRAPAREVVARLRRDNLQAFITTEKRV